MSARLLEIFAVLGQQKAVRGAQDTSEAAFSFVEGDTYRLRLNAQRPVADLGSTQRYTPATFSEFVSFEAALGQVDAAPEGGTWKIKKTGTTLVVRDVTVDEAGDMQSLPMDSTGLSVGMGVISPDFNGGTTITAIDSPGTTAVLHFSAGKLTTGSTVDVHFTAASAFGAALPFNATTAQVKTAVEALAGIGADKVVVTNGNAPHIYIIRPVSSADDFTFEALSALVPLCTARVRKGSDGSGSYTVIKLHKAYFAFADQWEFPMPPEVEVTSERTGSTTKNATQIISIPQGAMGSFELQHAGFSTRTIAVDGITAAAVESALNELFADGNKAPRFRCFEAGSLAIQVECIGALAKQAVPTLGIELYGQVPLSTPEADFALTELPLELFIAAKDKLKLVLDIVGIDAEGREHTLVLRDAEIRNSLIDRSTSATIGAVATRYVEVTTTVDADAPIQVGFRSTTIIATGSGTTGVPGEYTENFTHNLNIRFPYIIAFRLISTSPEKWEQVDDDDFTVETISLTQSKVQFAEIPPTTGHVGSIKLIALNPEAGVWTNDHRHSTDEVDGVGGDSAKTLTAIIGELRAAMPDGWPSIPGNALEAASVTADKLELASLIAALFANTEFLTSLRDLATDSTFVKMLLESMATTSSLGEFVKQIAATIATDRTVAEEWLKMFRELSGFDVFLRELLISGLQGLSSLPPGTVLFAIPAFEFAQPPPQEIPAPSKRTEVFADVQVTDTTTPSGNTTVTTSKAASASYSELATVRYDLLSPAIFAAADGGDVSGLLSPTATEGQKYTAIAAVNARTATTRRGRDWKSSTILTRKNGHWFDVRVDGTTLWPREMETELLRLDVSADMFFVGARFALAWLLQASLEGNATGKIDLICELGATASGGGVAVPVWTPIFTQRIPLTPSLALHQFSVSVERTSVTTSETRDFIGGTGATAFTLDTRGLQSGMAVTGTDFAPGTLLDVINPDSETGVVNTSQAKLSSGTNTCVCTIATPQQNGTCARYGVSTAFEVPAAAFAIRVRVANFDCEDTWTAGSEARGCMKLKIANPSASIAPL